MRISVVAILVALSMPPAAIAQEREGIDLDLLAGGAGTFQDLNASSTAYLASGPFFGAVVDWAPSSAPGLALLGEIAWTHHVLRGSDAGVGAGTHVELFSVGGDVGYIYVNTQQFAATFFGGGGVLFIYEATTTAARVKPFSRLGLDARYRISSRLLAYTQVAAMVYTLSGFPEGSVLAGYEHRQAEASIGVGLAVRF